MTRQICHTYSETFISDKVRLFSRVLYLVEAAAGRVLLAGPELLKLGVQDVHQLFHEPHGGADVSCEHGALRVPGQLIGQVRRILSTPDLTQFRTKCVITDAQITG